MTIGIVVGIFLTVVSLVLLVVAAAGICVTVSIVVISVVLNSVGKI